MEAKRGRPPKPPEDKQTERVELRMTAAEKESFESAATKAELSLSAWIRERLKSAARRELRR